MRIKVFNCKPENLQNEFNLWFRQFHKPITFLSLTQSEGAIYENDEIQREITFTVIYVENSNLTMVK